MNTVFLDENEAINATKSRSSYPKIIFGDRASVAIIRGVKELALRNSDSIGVYTQLIKSFHEEMARIDAQIRNELNKSEFEGDGFESAAKIVTIEIIKGNTAIRGRIFLKLDFSP